VVKEKNDERGNDMNVIFLLMAMMIIVGILKKTGVFQWMAYKSYQLAKGNVFVLASVLMFVTAVTSAFLDNVTTMLLIIPVTIEIAQTLTLNPVTFLVPEAFASNVGGTATLIGDPSNIMIGSYAKLTFVDFVQHLTLVNTIALAITIVYFLFWFRKEYGKGKVAGAEEEGLIQLIADLVKDISRGSLMVAILMILWVSALASAIIDNIPFSATMLITVILCSLWLLVVEM
jgi:Na+/H+ antiporter NhaD/arsenite permease-like protein